MQAAADAFLRGDGPIGWVSCGGLWRRIGNLIPGLVRCILGVLKKLPLCGKKFKKLAKSLSSEFGGDAESGKMKGGTRDQERALLAGAGGGKGVDGEVRLDRIRPIRR